MRDEVLDYLRGQNLGVFTVTTELPWSENGLALYLKNLKKIYVDRDNVESTPLIATLDAIKVYSEVTTVTIYLGCDAKVTPPNLSEVVDIIREAKNITTISGVNRRDCDVSTSYENDVLVTRLDIRFTKITN